MGVPAYVVAAAAAVTLGVMTLAWAVAGSRPRRPPGLALTQTTVTDQRRIDLQTPAWERFVRPLIGSAAKRIRHLTPAGWVRVLERRWRLAGSPTAWPVNRILGIKLLLGVITLVVSVFLITRLSLTAAGVTITIGRFVLALLLSFLAYLLPDLILVARGRERTQLIQLSMSDSLDQMTISVEAGLGFDAALQRVAQSSSGPLGIELKRTLNEISIGLPRRQAFQNLVERTDVPELRRFVFAVNQAEAYGIPIAQVLRVQSQELRVMRRQRAEERAMKIPVKIVLPLVLCIFPALFVVILVPAMIQIFEVLF